MEKERGPVTVKEVATSFGASGATGLAKASPGVAVGAGAAELLSTSVQDLITYGTLLYIAMMCFYSLPKVWDTVRYFREQWTHRHGSGFRVSLVRDSEITQKIQEMQIRDLEKQVADLKSELAKRNAKGE